MPMPGASSMTLPVTTVSASAEIPTGRVSGLERAPAMLRTILLAHTASLPPSLKLVIEMPKAASSMRLPATMAPSKANSTKIATSPSREQELLTIWQWCPELLRTALKAQSLMRFCATSTLPARNTLMPLPFWPLPPSFAAIGRSGTARAFECEAAERDIGRIVEDEDGLLRSRYQCRPPRHAGDLDRLIDPEAGDDVSAGRNDQAGAVFDRRFDRRLQCPG